MSRLAGLRWLLGASLVGCANNAVGPGGSVDPTDAEPDASEMDAGSDTRGWDDAEDSDARSESCSSDGWCVVPFSSRADLMGVWGRSDDEVYVVGTDSSVARWNGSEWTSFVRLPREYAPNSIVGDGAGNLWVSAPNWWNGYPIFGTLLRVKADGSWEALVPSADESIGTVIASASDVIWISYYESILRGQVSDQTVDWHAIDLSSSPTPFSSLVLSVGDDYLFALGENMSDAFYCKKTADGFVQWTTLTLGTDEGYFWSLWATPDGVSVWFYLGNEAIRLDRDDAGAYTIAARYDLRAFSAAGIIWAKSKESPWLVLPQEIWHWVENQWVRSRTDIPGRILQTPFTAVWGAPGGDLWVVGANGTIVRKRSQVGSQD